MAEIYTVTATVIRIGTLESFTSQNGKSLERFDLEIQVGDELRTIDSLGFHWKNLKVGGIYELDIMPQDNPDYKHSLRKVTYVGEGNPTATTSNPIEKPKETQAPDPTPRPTPNPAALPTLKPDFASRWREYNTHARTAQMQATQRVEMYVSVFLAGKLQSNEGEKPDALSKTTLETWISQEINKYWNELDVRAPQDSFGHLQGNDNG